MSVEQTDRVDAIGIDVKTGKTILTISDHLDWDDEKGHLLTLQEKLNTYLRFIESGELLDAYPDAAGRALVVDIVTRVEMPQIGLRFLERIRPVLLKAGVELRTRVLPE